MIPRAPSGADRPVTVSRWPDLLILRPLDQASPRTRAQAPLSSQQRVGQRVIFSYPGLTVPSALLQQITAGEGAGVIFFGDNISGEAQIASVIQRLRAAQRQSPVSSPLLLMTDQEGGEVGACPCAPCRKQRKSANPYGGSPADGAGTIWPCRHERQPGTGAGLFTSPAISQPPPTESHRPPPPTGPPPGKTGGRPPPHIGRAVRVTGNDTWLRLDVTMNETSGRSIRGAPDPPAGRWPARCWARWPRPTTPFRTPGSG